MKKLVVFVIILVGCSNARMAKIQAWGKKHHVTCYSGGVVIYDGDTSGKIENEMHSDGYYFQDDKTGKLVGVSGNCVITVP